MAIDIEKKSFCSVEPTDGKSFYSFQFFNTHNHKPKFRHKLIDSPSMIVLFWISSFINVFIYMFAHLIIINDHADLQCIFILFQIHFPIWSCIIFTLHDEHSTIHFRSADFQNEPNLKSEIPKYCFSFWFVPIRQLLFVFLCICYIFFLLLLNIPFCSQQ